MPIGMGPAAQSRQSAGWSFRVIRNVGIPDRGNRSIAQFPGQQIPPGDFRAGVGPGPLILRPREESGIPAVLEKSDSDLLEVVDAADRLGPLPRLVESRQQHRRQNGDDRNHDKEFDQSKNRTNPESPGRIFAAHGKRPSMKFPVFFLIMSKKNWKCNLLHQKT